MIANDQSIDRAWIEVLCSQLYGMHNHEETVIFSTILAEKEPELAKKWTEGHEEASKELKELPQRFQAIIDEKDEEKRKAILENYYDFFMKFVTEDLLHMAFEENEIMQAFWRHFDDQQLNEIEANLIKILDKEFMMRALPLLVEGHNIGGKISILTKVPPPVQAIFLGLIEKLAPEELAIIKQRLSL